MRLIDADQMAFEESEAYTKVQTSGEVSPITFGINSVVHRKIQQLIADAPTVDAVEVVRCKDCAYYEANCCFNPQWDLESSTELPLVREIDFCSCGERKDGERE